MRFRGQYFFLSNFYPSPLSLGGTIFPTLEHAYQACKTLSWDHSERIRMCPTPGQAKRLGRRLPLRPGWEAKKVDTMLDLLRRKFYDTPELKALLLATGDIPLVEENDWNDTFWGVCNGKGQNWLGKLLMQVREELVVMTEKENGK